MSTDSISVQIAPQNALEKSDTWRRTRLRGMAELEASLERSRKALVALDLTGIESQTEEQAVLVRQFDELIEEGLRMQTCRRSAAEDEEARLNATRIVDAVRLHAALLTRAQQKLRVLSSMLAGPSLTYGPFLGPTPPGHQVRTANFCSVIGESVTGGSVTGERI